MKENMKTYKFDWARFISYLLTIIYPNYIIISYTVNTVKDLNVTFLKFINIFDIILDHRALFNFVFISSVFIIPGIVFSLSKIFADNKLKFVAELLSTILFSLNQVVETKRKRFLDYKIYALENNPDKEHIFATITQPLQQIIKIFDGVKYSFSKICKDEDIKVSIIKCSNNKLSNYIYHSDDAPNISIEQLIQNKSTARHVISKKKPLLIQNTDKKYLLNSKPWFYKGENDICDIKSIYCFPVKSGNQIIFIVTLTSKEPLTFRNKHKNAYDFMLNEFGSRLILESYLLDIKHNN